MTPGRLLRQREFTPVPSHGSIFDVYMIQNVMPARVTPGKRVRFTSEASIWLTETGKEQYVRRKLPNLHFECNWKNTLFGKHVGTNIGRATAKTMGCAISM